MTLRTSPADLVADSTNPLVGKHSSWERVPLAEVADILNGYAFESSQFNKDGEGVPLIRIRDVGASNTGTWFRGGYDERYVVQSGELLVGMDGAFRAARWEGPPALLNQRVCKITLRRPDVYDERFLLHVLPGYLGVIHAATSSLTVKHLSSRSVGEIPLPFPPLTEQRLIVEAIEERCSRLDAALGSLNLAERRLRTLRTSLLNAAATGALVGAEGARWARRTVGSLASEVRYGTSVRASKESSGVAILRMGNVVDSRLRLDDLRYLPEDHPEFPALLLEPGDVLFNRTNSPELVGKAAVYRGMPAPCSFASYLIRVRLGDECLPDWLCYYLASPPGRRWAKSVVSQQVGQANINGTKLKALELPLPAPSIQEKIVRLTDKALFQVDEQANALREARGQAGALRRAVLHEAFAGRLVPVTGESVLDERVEA